MAKGLERKSYGSLDKELNEKMRQHIEAGSFDKISDTVAGYVNRWIEESRSKKQKKAGR